MCDTHLVVIDNRREMVSGEEVRFEQNGIGGEGRVGVAQAAENEVGLWSGARWENRVLKKKTGGGFSTERSACVDEGRGTHVQSQDVLFAGAHTARDLLGGERQTMLVVGRV